MKVFVKVLSWETASSFGLHVDSCKGPNIYLQVGPHVDARHLTVIQCTRCGRFYNISQDNIEELSSHEMVYNQMDSQP